MHMYGKYVSKEKRPKNTAHFLSIIKHQIHCRQQTHTQVKILDATLVDMVL